MKPFDDGSHVIYVNTSAEDDGTEIWKLIHDLRCPNADEMFFPRLAARVKFFKYYEEESETVGDYFEDLQAKAVEKAVEKAVGKAVEKAVKETQKKDQENFVISLIKFGANSLEDIAKISGLTLRRVQTLAKRCNTEAVAKA